MAETALPFSATPQFIEVGSIKTRTVDCGSGEPVVFLHSGAFSEVLCSNLFAFEHNIGELAEEFRIIAFDTLGHGETRHAAAEDDYTADAMIRHAREVLRRLGVARAHLVGHDQGALVALRLAFDDPALVASCTLVSSPAVAPTGDELPNYTLAGRMAPHFSREDQEWILDRLSYTPHHIAAGRYLDEVTAIAESARFQAFRERIEQAQVFPKYVRPSLARLKSNTFARFRDQGAPAPTLIIWGQQDPVCPARAALVLFDLIARRQRQTQIRLINHAGYMPFREQPAVFNTMLAGFIRGLGGAAL